MSLPILYSFRRCPYAMRARMGLIVSGTACELREVVLRAKPPELIAASPKATVPVLVLPNGRVIEQSLDILRWALDVHDPEDWRARDDPALIASNDDAFKHHLDRYKYPDRHDSDPREHRAAALTLLGPLEERLAKHANLCGAVRGLADIATFPFVRQFAAVEPDWFAEQPIPRVQAWLAGHLASALFLQAMIRRTPWQAGDAAIYL